MKKSSYLSRAAAGATPIRLSAMSAALLAVLSAPALASVAVPVTAGAPVVISQVYGGGGNTGAKYKNDFIELFNRSDAPVSLSGWSVQYASAAGSSWQVTKISGNPVLQPGQYYLVQEAAGNGAGSALVPDSSGTVCSLAEKVIFCSC